MDTTTNTQQQPQAQRRTINQDDVIYKPRMFTEYKRYVSTNANFQRIWNNMRPEEQEAHGGYDNYVVLRYHDYTNELVEKCFSFVKLAEFCKGEAPKPKK